MMRKRNTLFPVLGEITLIISLLESTVRLNVGDERGV